MSARRDFLLGLGAALLVRPLPARAQQPAAPVIGFLTTRSPDEAAAHTEAFRRGLRDEGYVEGENLTIQYRWANGRYERLPALAADLTDRRVAAIAAGGDPAALAAQAAARGTVPVVFIIGDDPVRLGLVASFNRPGGNATGVSLITSALGSKRLELLCELVPDAGTVALLVNPGNPNAEAQTEEVRAAARKLGRRLIIARASTEPDIETSFQTLSREGARALVVENDPFFDTRRARLLALAARHAVPAIYHIREFPAAGGLMSYGPSLVDGYYKLGAQTGRVLKGTSPSQLPVARPTQFELVINLQTARALGLNLPPLLLDRADEVIE